MTPANDNRGIDDQVTVERLREALEVVAYGIARFKSGSAYVVIMERLETALQDAANDNSPRARAERILEAARTRRTPSEASAASTRKLKETADDAS